MLRELHIRNFALVDQLDLEFGPGMNVLTGETGAGKSILLDALGLALGDRADSTMVRHGTERAEVSVAFDASALTGVAEWLRGQELDADGECLIRRTVGADGRSRGYINGQPSTLQQLRELGEQLVDIHGQHAHQSLLRREVQRQTLDDYAGHRELLTTTTEAYHQWRALVDEFDALRRANADRDARLELLRYQVEELTAMAPHSAELSELEEEHHRLAHAQRLQETAQTALAELYEEDGAALVERLEHLAGEIQGLTEFDDALTSCGEMLEGAAIQAREAANELRRYLSDLDNDPARLAEIEERLGAYHELGRKHRAEPEALEGLLGELSRELNKLENAGQRLDRIEADIHEVHKRYDEAARTLGASRREAAGRLSEQVTANMQELGMEGGQFTVRLEPIEGDDPHPHGREKVELEVTANAGQPLRPLAKVASGGELSRISLALQVITASQGGIPTLIFDEVDVGIGGRVAEMVGQELRTLGEERQVLCVTHQPQVAAQGHVHYLINKQAEQDNTRTEVVQLDREARVGEVARMLGGLRITEQTLAHAREMLELAAGGSNRRRDAAG